MNITELKIFNDVLNTLIDTAWEERCVDYTILTNLENIKFVIEMAIALGHTIDELPVYEEDTITIALPEILEYLKHKINSSQ